MRDAVQQLRLSAALSADRAVRLVAAAADCLAAGVPGGRELRLLCLLELALRLPDARDDGGGLPCGAGDLRLPGCRAEEALAGALPGLQPGDARLLQVL